MAVVHLNRVVMHCERRLQMRDLTMGVLLAAFPLVVVAGCGKQPPAAGSVAGRVTFESQPVAAGHVVFENPGQGWLRAAPLDSDGRYNLPEVRVGDYTVTIQPPEPNRPNEATSMPAEIRAQMATVKYVDPKNIPRQFRSVQTSPLKRSVVPGSNEFDFELSTKQK
jgi:hypothetical protein